MSGCAPELERRRAGLAPDVRCGGRGQLVEEGAGARGGRKDLLALVALERVDDDRDRLLPAAGDQQHLGEVHERRGLRIDPVGPQRELDRFPGERLSRLDLATLREQQRSHPSPGHLRGDPAPGCGLLGDRRELIGLLISAQRIQAAREPTGGEREVALVAHRGQLLVGSSQLELGGVPISANHLDVVAEALAA